MVDSGRTVVGVPAIVVGRWRSCSTVVGVPTTVESGTVDGCGRGGSGRTVVGLPATVVGRSPSCSTFASTVVGDPAMVVGRGTSRSMVVCGATLVGRGGSWRTVVGVPVTVVGCSGSGRVVDGRVVDGRGGSDRIDVGVPVTVVGRCGSGCSTRVTGTVGAGAVVVRGTSIRVDGGATVVRGGSAGRSLARANAGSRRRPAAAPANAVVILDVVDKADGRDDEVCTVVSLVRRGGGEYGPRNRTGVCGLFDRCQSSTETKSARYARFSIDACG